MLSVLVYLSLPLVPLVGLVLALLAPLPLLQVTASGRPSFMAWGWVAVVGTGGALLTSSTWLAVLTLGYLATTAWPAVSVESWRRRGWSEGRWLAILVAGRVRSHRNRPPPGCPGAFSVPLPNCERRVNTAPPAGRSPGTPGTTAGIDDRVDRERASEHAR